MDPLALVLKMSKELDKRQSDVEAAENWWSGAHPIPPPPANTAATTDAEARIAYIRMAQLGVTNFLPPIVDLPSDALQVDGYRFGDSPTATDSEAWRIWQRNDLDSDSGLGNHGALKTGQTFALVWVDDDRQATITVEDASQAIVLYQPGSRRIRAAGLKRWVDDDGYLCATLYLPSFIHKYRSKAQISSTSGLILPTGSTDWEPRPVDGEPWPLPNPLGVVNLVEIRVGATLKPALYGGGMPAFAKQINEQRKINHTVFSLLVTMDYQSFRQRWVTGWDPPVDDQGRPDKAAILKAGAARVMTFGSGEDGGEANQVNVGEFTQADLRPILEVITAWVKVIASTSGTPPYAFLLGDMINVAADSLARIEGVQLGRRIAFSRQLGKGWNEALRLALLAESNPKADDTTGGVVWADFEQRTATEQANLAQIMRNLGVPDEVVYATLPGISQQEADRWIRQAAANKMLGGVVAGDTTGFVYLKAQAEAAKALVDLGIDPAAAAEHVGLPNLTPAPAA